MRKLIYFVATTIDGRIAGPGGQTDFFPMAGAHIAAQVQQLPETLPRHVREALDVPERQARFDTVVMGRGTYQPALSAGITHPYAPLETIVFSRTLPERSEGNLRITAADPRRVVQELKGRAGRDIWLCGGADLASQLADEIDELVVKVNPVLAGDGIPLLRGGFRPEAFFLRHHEVFSSGVVWLGYERADGSNR